MNTLTKIAVIIGYGLLSIVVILCFFMLGTYINHTINLNKEKDLLPPLGELVQVDGAKMSVYSEGEGDETLVFLSGSGTCSPIIDFKSLYSLLSDDYKVVVVERFGYGFSDITNKSKDIDTILEYTRAALEKSGATPPYTLCAHSMSGIEALYWAEKYPDEVSSIIGLDMATPAMYEKMKINTSMMSLLQFGVNLGIARYGKFSESAAILNGTLTDKEKEIYRAVFFTRTMTKDMINEARYIKENAKKVANTDMSHIPTLMFCSNGSGGTGFTKEEWQKLQGDFATKNNAEMQYLDCGHYVHNYKYNEIAQKMRSFLNDQ